MKQSRISEADAISLSGFYARYGKRILDILLSIVGLVVLAPLSASIAISIRLTMGRPAFFRQVRPGLNRHGFNIFKFRTMMESRDGNGTSLPDRMRLTGFGRFLRMGSLDELPELWNVVRGDMSLVGPRPLLIKYLPYFRKEEVARFEARPGITGLAQVVGRNKLSWDQRFSADIEYVRNIAFLKDIKILALTLGQVLSSRGVEVDPGAAMMNLDDERSIQR